MFCRNLRCIRIIRLSRLFFGCAYGSFPPGSSLKRYMLLLYCLISSISFFSFARYSWYYPVSCSWDTLIWGVGRTASLFG